MLAVTSASRRLTRHTLERRNSMDKKPLATNRVEWRHGTCSMCGREAMVRLIVIHGDPYYSCSRKCDLLLVEEYDATR